MVQTARTAIDLLWVACDHLGHCRSLDFLNHVRYTVRSRANPIVRFEKEVQAHTIKQGVSSWFAEHRKTNNYRICILAVENTDLGMDNSDIAVSYTHLDVYKRQEGNCIILALHCARGIY